MLGKNPRTFVIPWWRPGLQQLVVKAEENKPMGFFADQGDAILVIVGQRNISVTSMLIFIMIIDINHT